MLEPRQALIYQIVVATSDRPLTIREIAEYTGGDIETGMMVDALVDADRLTETWSIECQDYVYLMSLELCWRIT